MTLARLMAVVATIALDLGLLKTWFIRANRLQFLMIIVVELGLFRAFSGRGSPRARAWWLGFAVFNLSYAAFDAAFHQPVREFITRPFVLRSPPLPQLPSTAQPDGPLRFRREADGIQFSLAIMLGIIGGETGRWIASRSHAARSLEPGAA